MASDLSTVPELSVIVAVKDEEENVPVLAAEIAAVLDAASLNWECVWVREGGHAMINGVRTRRQDGFVRRISSKIANALRNLLTGETVTDVGCAIRVCKKEAVLAVPVWKGMHRFLPTLVKLQGFSIDEIPVNHRRRERGGTKYGIHNRLWAGIGDTFAVCWMKRRLVFPRVK